MESKTTWSDLVRLQASSPPATKQPIRIEKPQPPKRRKKPRKPRAIRTVRPRNELQFIGAARIYTDAEVSMERSCLGKVKYLTIKEAWTALRALRRRGAVNVEAYICKYCPSWHVGHKIQRQDGKN